MRTATRRITHTNGWHKLIRRSSITGENPNRASILCFDAQLGGTQSEMTRRELAASRAARTMWFAVQISAKGSSESFPLNV